VRGASTRTAWIIPETALSKGMTHGRRRTHSRRRFLATAAAVGPAAALAGCLDSGGAGDGPDGDGDRIATYDVGGSPGDPVPIRPDGQVALLDFWATWCAPCEPQMAELREIRERFPNVHILSITNEDQDAPIREFWTDHQGTWPVASDPELRTNDRFDVTRIPTLLVFDPDGTEVWRHVGLAAADSIAEALGDAGV